MFAMWSNGNWTERKRERESVCRDSDEMCDLMRLDAVFGLPHSDFGHVLVNREYVYVCLHA